MAVTMKDIAERANVSRQVVSRALSDSTACRISVRKREEIKRIANELGFRSNYAALQLKGEKTRTLAIFFPSYFEIKMGTIWSLIEKLRHSEYKTYVMSVDTEEDFADQVDDCIARGVVGFISVGLRFQKPARVNVPFIRILTEYGEEAADIDFDRVAGARITTRHLIGHGRRRIGFLNMGAHPHSLQKVKGIQECCEEAGYEFKAKHQIDILQRPDACQMIQERIKSCKLDAMIFNNDILAGKVMAFLKQSGYRVPDDIAVIGCTGYTFTEFTDPPLTTLVEPYQKIGELGTGMILELLEKKRFKPERPVILVPKLKIGGSCGCPASKITRIYWEGPMAMLDENTNFIVPPPREMIDDGGYLKP